MSGARRRWLTACAACAALLIVPCLAWILLPAAAGPLPRASASALPAAPDPAPEPTASIAPEPAVVRPSPLPRTDERAEAAPPEEDGPVRGSVVDSEGRPVAGAD